MTTSTTPEDPTLLIHAYVDGELDPANALEVERRTAADPALAAERDRVTALRAALARHFPREPAPAAYATIAIGCDIGDAIMKACEQFAPERVGTASIDLVICFSHGVDARNNGSEIFRSGHG